MQDITIIIATYGQRLESKYNMLPEILESIRAQRGKNFRVVVINNTVERQYHKKISKKIDKIIKPFKKSLKVTQFNYMDLEKLHKFFTLNAYGEFMESVLFGNYSSFRNIGLIVAGVLGSSIALFLDDDEIIEDKLFLKKAREFIGKSYKGKFIGGISGYYINRNGSYLLPRGEMERWWSFFWNKTWYINEAFAIIGKRERVKETTFAFGGNMVLHSNLFTAVPFDPYILRGEDIDMMINAKAYGFAFLLDNQLAVKHIHPPRTHKEWWRDLRRDAYRFEYERRKVIGFIQRKKLPPDIIKKLDPYPGPFLRRNMYPRLIVTCVLLGIDCVLSLRPKGVVESLRTIKIVILDAKKYAKENCRKYFGFQQRWAEMMQDIAKDKALAKYFKNKF